MVAISVKAIACLRDASRSPLVIQSAPPMHNSNAQEVVVRADGRGSRHQKKTFDALLKNGLVEETPTNQYAPSPAGMRVLGGG